MARNGREAITIVEELRPDIVTMDVRMPVMDGLATTEHLMAYCPTPILVLTASLASHEVDITFKMLHAGALEVLEKPHNTGPQALERAGYDLVRRIKMLARVKVVTHLRGRRKLGERDMDQQPSMVFQHAQQPSLSQSLTAVAQPAQARSAAQPRPASANGARPAEQPAAQTTFSTPRWDFPLIVIGASTGGPRVVHQILRDLPRSLPAAVMVVQHIAAGFSVGMAEWLASASALPVYLAREGQPIRAGEVLVAPDQRDLMITPALHGASQREPAAHPAAGDRCHHAGRRRGLWPAGDRRAADRHGARWRLWHARRSGALAATRSPRTRSSSAIFGMPRAAIQLGAATEVLSPPQIATRVVEVLTA